MLWKRRVSVSERRAHPRIAPPGLIRIDHENPGTSIPNAQILDISRGGVALRCQQWIEPGERLVFATIDGLPPVLCEVLECKNLDNGWFRVRCRCVLGGFSLPR